MVDGEWVFITAGGQRWHTRADCEALLAGWEEAKKKGASTHPAQHVPVERALSRQPCGWCAVPAKGGSRVEQTTRLLMLRTDTEYEALFRDHVLGELPELTGWTPASQRDITVAGTTYRVDFTLEEAGDRIAIEIDGADKGPGGPTHDEWTRRQTALVTEGWVPLRFTNRQVRDDPEYCRRQVAVTVARLRERRLQPRPAPIRDAVETHAAPALHPATQTGEAVGKAGLSSGAKVLIAFLVVALIAVGVQLGLATRPADAPASTAGSPDSPASPAAGGDEEPAVAATAAPISEYDCPPDQPIKGNVRQDVGTRLYQVPESSFYNRTKPEACFRDVPAAVAAGFSAPPGT